MEWLFAIFSLIEFGNKLFAGGGFHEKGAGFGEGRAGDGTRVGGGLMDGLLVAN